MAAPATVVRIRPDRLTIWPNEQGTYGVDARWGGPEGFRQANAVRDAAQGAGLAVKLRQEPDGGWTVRVGPLARDEALRVVETFVI